MMPARVALALQADGWWLRSKVIWHKPNPMPESILDRPTSSYEELFLFTKSGSTTFCDASCARRRRIRVAPEPDHVWHNSGHRGGDCRASRPVGAIRCPSAGTPESVVRLWRRVNLWDGHDYFHDAEAVRTDAMPQSLMKYKGAPAPEASAEASDTGIANSKPVRSNLRNV